MRKQHPRYNLQINNICKYQKNTKEIPNKCQIHTAQIAPTTVPANLYIALENPAPTVGDIVAANYI